MPDLTIVNNLDEAIHVAFFMGAPTHWKNHLQPNERWTTHLPTMPLYFQVRWVERPDYDSGYTWRSREFGGEESGEMLATIGVACAAGTASVLCAAAGVGMRSSGTLMLSAPLMAAASAGGQRYASMGSDTKLYETRVWVPWFEHKVYSVRNVGGGHCVLWDLNADRQV